MRWRAALAGALIAVSVAGAGWVALYSPVFSVERVQVTGETYTSEAAVLDRAQVRRGTPLARIDVGRIAGAVGELGPVRSVDVERRPPHTVRIVLHERTPVASAAGRSGRFVLLDRTGARIITVKGRPDWLPFVDTHPRLRSTPAARSALAVASALPHDLADRVRLISAPQPDTVRLRLRGGATVMWGDSTRSPAKARALRALLRVDATAYDVSSPEVVTTRN